MILDGLPPLQVLAEGPGEAQDAARSLHGAHTHSPGACWSSDGIRQHHAGRGVRLPCPNNPQAVRLSRLPPNLLPLPPFSGNGCILLVSVG